MGLVKKSAAVCFKMVPLLLALRGEQVGFSSDICCENVVELLENSTKSEWMFCIIESTGYFCIVCIFLSFVLG